MDTDVNPYAASRLYIRRHSLNIGHSLRAFAASQSRESRLYGTQGKPIYSLWLKRKSLHQSAVERRLSIVSICLRRWRVRERCREPAIRAPLADRRLGGQIDAIVLAKVGKVAIR